MNKRVILAVILMLVGCITLLISMGSLSLSGALASFCLIACALLLANFHKTTKEDVRSWPSRWNEWIIHSASKSITLSKQLKKFISRR